MPGSFNTIDYRLRPAKHAERTMFIDLFKRLRFASIESYQYVGFGSVAFVDFRMVHKSLGIKDMTSIEATDDPSEQLRFLRNKPYSKIKVLFGKASTLLPTLNFSKRSLVWLDYDGSLDRSMANDLAAIARRACSGTFLAVTFTAVRPASAEKRAEQLVRLKDQFEGLLPNDAKERDLEGSKFAEFGRMALSTLVERAINGADAGEPDIGKQRSLKQVCFFRYKDGAPMVTIGWMIVANNELESFRKCDFGSLPFVRTDKSAFEIKVPLTTPFEIHLMERRLPTLSSKSLKWIPDDEKAAFKSIYRYLPHFSVIEQI